MVFTSICLLLFFFCHLQSSIECTSWLDWFGETNAGNNTE